MFTEDLIDKVAVHDSTHFEVKLDYSIDSDKKYNEYRVASYFFIPRTLGVNKQTYPRQQFYNDVVGYIRFKTPSIALEVLADTEDGIGPLAHICELLAQVKKAPGDKKLQKTLGHELRMFGCVVRAKVRDLAKELRDQARSVARKSSDRHVLIDDLRSAWAHFLADIDAVITTWRGLRPEMVSAPVPKFIRDAYMFVDEYLSLIVEDRLTGMLRAVEGAELNGSLDAELEHTREVLLGERSHRQGAGYASVVEEESDNEHYLFRQSLLKKFVMSVLWLEIAKQKEGGRAADVGAAIAAGTAMFVTLLATIMHMKWWMINTWGFVVAATITYILKDRIKDWLKVFFRNRFDRFLADYSVAITDPATGQRLGHCRESFSYVSSEDVPRDVLAFRHKNATTDIEIMAKPEVVLRYQKDVRLSGSAIVQRLQVDDWDINDIMRFGVSSFFARADDPESVVSLFEPETDKVEKRTFPRVYHVNVVLVLSAGKKSKAPPMMKRLRVVFDKNGIRRLEQVD